tara:strand:- start:39 stop:1064 length:1026 start_codon:yes stop_codon:yes gene_type:complete
MTTFANRYIGIGKESTYGSASGSDAYGEMDDENFSENFDLLTRADITRFGSTKSIDSKHYGEGTVNGVLQPDFFIMRLLNGVYGNHTPGGTPGIADTLAESAGNTLPSFTVRIGRDENAHEFTGQVVESVSVSATVGEYAMFSASLTGKGQNTSLLSLASPSYDYTGDAAHFVGAYVNFEAPATNSNYSKLIQSIDFEIKTNRDMDNSYGLGDATCTRAAPMQLREITGNITFHKAVLSGDVTSFDEPHYTELLAGLLQDGTTAAPALSALFYVDSLNYIRFDFPKVHYGAPTTSISGRDSQTMSVPFTVLYDAAETFMSKVTFSSASTKLKGGGATDMDA